MRLITLGDSGTAGDIAWPRKLSDKLNCELINFAKPASQVLLQIQLIQDWLIDNDLNQDDIIIWQIGWSLHPVVHVKHEHIDLVQKADKFVKNKLGIAHYHLRNNKIDDEKRISLLPISPVLHKFFNRKKTKDEAEVLHQLLFMIIILQKLCPRVLVTRAQNDFLQENHWDNLQKLFVEKKIDFLNEGMYDWCIANNFDTEYFHPTEKSYGIYVEQVLYPKLKELGWI